MAQIADADVKVLVGGEQSEPAEHVDNAAHAHVPEEVFRSFGAALPGLVNFAGGHRLRKG